MATTKTPRRVLGDLTPNVVSTVSIDASGIRSPSQTPHDQSPLKAQTALQLSVQSRDKENISLSAAVNPRKRPFSALESPRRQGVTPSPAKRQHEMLFETVSPAALRSPVPPPVTIELADDDSTTDEDEAIEPMDESAEGEGPTATQGTVGSFSDLIDYNPDDASEKSGSTPLASCSSPLASIPITSRVELLKLRLRMAMYKINTNQTLVPFSQLEVPHARTHTIPQEDDQDEDGLLEQAFSAQSANARRNSTPAADNIIITGGPIAKLLAGPVFAPTAFSARFIGGPGTPAGSPTRPHARDERELTSSVVKGHAADGLLELAHSR